MYEHLNLKAWPFQIVPDPQFATVWAGRHKTKDQLGRLLWKMQFAPKSSIHLLWANFGMGKTHTLYHIQHLCKQSKGRLIPLYAVMPKRVSGFLDVYRAIVSEMPYDFLGDQLVQAGSGSGGSMTQHPLFVKSPGVVNALLAIRSGDAERAMAARQWLSAQPGLSAHDLRAVGVTYRIKTPEDAVSVLTVLTRLAGFKSDPFSKLVIMLDEFQRIGELKPRIAQEINSGIHTFFNENPNGLEIILAFSFGRQEDVSFLLSKELRSRAEPQTISLDVLSESEGEEFVRDLLNQFRIDKDDRWAYPFTPGSLKALIKYITKSQILTPRRLMKYANYVLSESQYTRGPELSGEITETDLKALLSDPRLGMLDHDDVEST
jgi:hypothetical protein